MEKVVFNKPHELITIRQRWVRFFANGLVSIYLIMIIMATIMSVFNSKQHLFWGIPVIIVSLLDIFFLTKSMLQKPKKIDTRLSTFIISVGATFGFGVWVMILTPTQFEWEHIELIRQMGKYLSIVPYLFVVWSLLCLKDCLTVIPEAHEVVAHGPYKYSRHPLYVCYMIWAIANFMMFPSFLMFLASIGQIAFLLIRLRREERLLLDIFLEYRAYYQTVGLLGKR